MAARLVNIDRNTPLLLSPDLREWVAEDDLVHFVIEAVGQMSLPTLKVNRRGTGSAQFPPRTMLALLIYCYANGIFSSRRIERATWRDVAVRYLMADHHPDHDTICKFRRENLPAVRQAFVELLHLARALGLLKVGTISIDGTKIAANASKDRNVRYDRACELEAELTAAIEPLLAKAEQADRGDEEDPSGDGQTLPERIDRLSKLREHIRQAREQMEQQAKTQAEAKQAGHAAKQAEYDRKQGHKGSPPKPPARTPKAKAQMNLTDGDSRLMRQSRRSPYVQGYNAQAAVDADGSMLILAGHVTQSASDANQLIPSIKAVSDNLEPPTAVLADSGYAKAETFEKLEQEVDLYVAVGREGNQRKYDYRPRSVTDKPVKPVKDPRLVKMREKLQTDEGRERYGKRKQTVEPVFGIIKSVMGFTRFLLRGVDKVDGEWSLVALAYNFKRLWTLKTTP